MIVVVVMMEIVMDITIMHTTIISLIILNTIVMMMMMIQIEILQAVNQPLNVVVEELSRDQHHQKQQQKQLRCRHRHVGFTNVGNDNFPGPFKMSLESLEPAH